jgi:RHS repeat-associated protein
MGCKKLTYNDFEPTLKVVYSNFQLKEKSCAGVYRWGFGGHEKVDEVSGSGNTIDMGGRWLDPRLGRTSSMDPKSGKYPYVSPYTYAVNNPLAFIDPDGKDVYLVIWFSKDGETGHAAIAVDNYKEVEREVKNATTGEVTIVKEMVKDGTVTYYDLWPQKPVGTTQLQKDVTADYNKRVLPLDDLTKTDPSVSSKKGAVSEFGEGRVPDGVVKISTGTTDAETFKKDEAVKSELDAVQAKNSGYNASSNNCSNFAETGLKAIDPLFDASQEVKVKGILSTMYKDATVTAPNNLYNAAAGRSDATVVSGPSSTEAKPYLEYFGK